MKIDENYTIKTDKHNVVLCYESFGELNEKGVPIRTYHESYYKDLADALSAYLMKSLSNSESIKGVLANIQDIRESVTAIKKAIANQ